MKNGRIAARGQVLLGIVGLSLTFGTYFFRADAIDQSMLDLEGLAGDAKGQAEIADRLLGHWSNQLEMMTGSVATHARTLDEVERLRLSVLQSTREWQDGMEGFAAVTDDASQVCKKFSDQLPLRIPTVDLETREMEFNIPEFGVTEQEISIPYPTASVGSREVKVDLGLTDVALRIPTLKVGSKDMQVKIPAAIQKPTRVESIVLPTDVDIRYRDILREEKTLLVSTSTQLATAAEALRHNQRVLSQVQELLRDDLAKSLSATESNLDTLGTSLTGSYQQDIPEFRQRLQKQAAAIERSQLNLDAARNTVPWMFLLASTLPAAILLQGLWNLSQVNAKSADDND